MGLDGEDFYGAYDAHDLANANSAELGVKTVPSLNVVYTEEKGYVTADAADKEGLTLKKLSGTKFRQIPRRRGHPRMVRLPLRCEGAPGEHPRWELGPGAQGILRHKQKESTQILPSP